MKEKVWKRSLWIFHFNASGCNGCDIELVDAITSRYDIERLGIKLVPSPRQADVLVVTGAVNSLTKGALKVIYDQIPEPKIVVALGTCACSGGIFSGCYNTIGGADKVIPVDVYIPGCPPRPEDIIEAFARIVGILEVKRNGKRKNSRKD